MVHDPFYALIYRLAQARQGGWLSHPKNRGTIFTAAEKADRGRHGKLKMQPAELQEACSRRKDNAMADSERAQKSRPILFCNDMVFRSCALSSRSKPPARRYPHGWPGLRIEKALPGDNALTCATGPRRRAFVHGPYFAGRFAEIRKPDWHGPR